MDILKVQTVVLGQIHQADVVAGGMTGGSSENDILRFGPIDELLKGVVGGICGAVDDFRVWIVACDGNKVVVAVFRFVEDVIVDDRRRIEH